MDSKQRAAEMAQKLKNRVAYPDWSRDFAPMLEEFARAEREACIEAIKNRMIVMDECKDDGKTLTMTVHPESLRDQFIAAIRGRE